jgi:hypothetical protein
LLVIAELSRAFSHESCLENNYRHRARFKMKSTSAIACGSEMPSPPHHQALLTCCWRTGMLISISLWLLVLSGLIEDPGPLLFVNCR